jgi:hypothetical protein
MHALCVLPRADPTFGRRRHATPGSPSMRSRQESIEHGLLNAYLEALVMNVGLSSGAKDRREVESASSIASPGPGRPHQTISWVPSATLTISDTPSHWT